MVLCVVASNICFVLVYLKFYVVNLNHEFSICVGESGPRL